MWIQRVKVKVYDPLIHSWNRFFNICTRILLTLSVAFLLRNHNLFLEKIVVDDCIPSSYLISNIIEVNLCVKCTSEAKINQLKFILKSVYQFYVNDVVLYKLLPVVGIEVTESIILRVIQLVLTQLHESNMIQSVAFLVRSCRRFLVKIQIVNDRHTCNVTTQLFTTRDRNFIDTYNIPRRKFLRNLLSHQS